MVDKSEIIVLNGRIVFLSFWGLLVAGRPLPASHALGQLGAPAYGRVLTAADLWARQPVVVMVTRRPGCLLCREEAAKLYAKKPELVCTALLPQPKYGGL